MVLAARGAQQRSSGWWTNEAVGPERTNGGARPVSRGLTGNAIERDVAATQRSRNVTTGVEGIGAHDGSACGSGGVLSRHGHRFVVAATGR